MMHFRGDIQALRGWAVALVVVEHAKIGLLPQGYLGVDVFFVISGFLITGILARSIEAGTFNFKDFYFRRARRILPAAYVTIVLTALAAIWFLTSVEINDFKAQVLGAVTFSINFVLWSQTDYFAVEADLKPLLHMWSLAIEEQYYILLPALMMLTPVRYWRAMMGSLFVVSLALCIVWARYDATGAFYMLPTRAWELAIGSLGAIYVKQAQKYAPVWRVLYWPALATLIVLPAISVDLPHPGVPAIAVCLATLVILLARNESLAATLPGRALAKVGDISYSLYLVHWPIMVFTFAAYLGEPPLSVRVAVIALSGLCAVLMYLLIETPARTAFQKPSWPFATATLTASVFTVLVSVGASAYARSEIDFSKVRAANHGLNKACDYSGKPFKPKEECQTSREPKILVWGDSFAMHLVPGIVSETKQGLVQASFSTCAALLGLSRKRNDIANPERWARSCISFNQEVLKYLEATPSIETVVLGNQWRPIVNDSMQILSMGEKSKLVAHKAGIDLAVESFGKTVAAIKQLGKKVVVFGPPPSYGVDFSVCVERMMTNKVILGSSDCRLDRRKAFEVDANVNTFLDRIARGHSVIVVRMADVLCTEDKCETILDGISVYSDSVHLSHAGSIAVMKRLHINSSL
ncbi:acyltransferase family protein [Microvirga solisilvae]|uniref:acyltransferase family protein n=1 Tax=Microvirga solisilvae TaxID=2919498 RepID=UPI001FAF1387|nr:acyltransferase family protein [Microvirga solisilvae]